MQETRMNYRMIDVGEKPVTRRRAVASGRFKARPETVKRVLAGDLPKGDPLKLAEIAGITGAKRTPDLLPLCHPLNIDSVRVSFHEGTSPEGDPEIEARCEVICHGKTGVEMEALTGVQTALLCIYDLTKGIDPELEISDIHLLEKEGGKNGHWRSSRFASTHSGFSSTGSSAPSGESPLFAGLRVAVLTVSDRCARLEQDDLTGPRIARCFEDEGAKVLASAIVPDEVTEIQGITRSWMQDCLIDAIIVTGGTGISPRDVTPEAFSTLWDRTLPGFGEQFRRKGAEKTPHAWISRAEAGLMGRTLVFLLPGSRRAVEDGLELLRETLPHLVEMVRGEPHR